MIYSKEDVKRMLDKIRKDAEANAFCYKNDNIPPRVVFLSWLLMTLVEIEDQL